MATGSICSGHRYQGHCGLQTNYEAIWIGTQWRNHDVLESICYSLWSGRVNAHHFFLHLSLGRSARSIIVILCLVDESFFDILERRAAGGMKQVFFDTPGQIEVFTWSASGMIITEVWIALFAFDTHPQEWEIPPFHLFQHFFFLISTT